MARELPLTYHAINRRRTRGISASAIEAALDYGKHRARRGAFLYTIGWREIRIWADRGVDLSRWESVQVVEAHNGRIVTVYRNRHARAIRDRGARKIAV